MDRPPRDPATPLFGAGDYLRLGRASMQMAAASLGAWTLGALRRGAGAEPSALAFTALATAQILHTRACRSGAGTGNPVLSRALSGTAALQLAALSYHPLREALSVRRTGPLDLAAAALIGCLPAFLRTIGDPEARDEIVVSRAGANRCSYPREEWS
jgi:hypothetical protein